MYTYDTLEFDDEYNDETEQSDLKNHFTLEEMKKIIEWVDEHPNARIATISHQFRKVKYMYYITRFREYVEKTQVMDYGYHIRPVYGRMRCEYGAFTAIFTSYTVVSPPYTMSSIVIFTGASRQ